MYGLYKTANRDLILNIDFMILFEQNELNRPVQFS